MEFFFKSFWQLRQMTRQAEFKGGNPLLYPCTPGNEPQLIRRSMVEDFNVDERNDEDDNFQSTIYRNILPSWFRYEEFPPVAPGRIWSYIRKYDESDESMTDRRPHFPRQVREMEIAIREGHERILIRDRNLSLYAQNLQRFGEYFHKNAVWFGALGFWTAFCFPQRWKWYTCFSVYAMMHAYSYCHFWRTDSLSRYEMFELPTEHIDTINEALYLHDEFWVLELIPKSRLTTKYLKNQLYAWGSLVFTTWRLMQIEDIVVGGPKRDIFLDHGIFESSTYFLPLSPRIHDVIMEAAIPTDVWKIYIRPGYAISCDTLLIFGLVAFFAWEEWDTIKARFGFCKKKKDESTQVGSDGENINNDSEGEKCDGLVKDWIF